MHQGKLSLTFFLGMVAAVVAGISGVGVWSVLVIGIPMSPVYFLFRSRYTEGHIRRRLQTGTARATLEYLGAIYLGTLVQLLLAYGLGWLVSKFL